MKKTKITAKIDELWPPLPYCEWKETLETLHMWMQIVGKVKLALAPFINQWWEVVFYITARGMTTGRIPYNNEIFQIDFDFISHNMSIYKSNNRSKTIPLHARSVADFYKEFIEKLAALGIHTKIIPVPVEVLNPIPFSEDTKHASYEAEYVTKWWRILVQINMVFDQFRSSFRGKSSPIHFFWGSFDLNGTRFNGKHAKPPKMANPLGKIMRFAENEENFAFGFWPGDQRLPYPAFYSYIYPAPKEMTTINFGENIYFNEALSECIMPYEVVQKTKDPRKTIRSFLNTTYSESAKLAGWDIKSLEGSIPS